MNRRYLARIEEEEDEAPLINTDPCDHGCEDDQCLIDDESPCTEDCHPIWAPPLPTERRRRTKIEAERDSYGH